VPSARVASADRGRLFVALDLDAAARSALLAWRAEVVADLPAVRPVGEGALHVTLCFLGSCAMQDVDAIAAACAIGSAAPVAGLRLGGAMWLPRRRPRVLAVALEDDRGALTRVQAALARALQAGGWYRAEARPFLAHVTVARVAKDERLRPPTLVPPPAVSLAETSTVTLYRSHLSSRGSRYEPVRVVAVGGSPPPPSADDPVAVVRRFHAEQAHAYAGGEIDRLRPLLAPDVVWHVPGRSRIAGEHQGPDAVLAYFDARRRLTDTTFRVTVHDVLAAGERVIQLAGGRAVRDGAELRWETVGIFRVADGRIAECWLVPFDLYAFDEVWS
jgi:2'-5' RNA ligase